MAYRPLAICCLTVVATLLVLSQPSVASAQDGNQPSTPEEGLQQRIDFGSAHILGQSIKSGAVYLMHRKKSDVTSMLQVRENYRTEIIEDFALEKTAIAASSPDTGNRLIPME